MHKLLNRTLLAVFAGLICGGITYASTSLIDDPIVGIVVAVSASAVVGMLIGVSAAKIAIRYGRRL